MGMMGPGAKPIAQINHRGSVGNHTLKMKINAAPRTPAIVTHKAMVSLLKCHRRWVPSRRY